jgi:hypothetical protein
MGITLKVTRSSLSLVPDAEYRAIFEGYQEVNFRFGDALRLRFKITDEKYDGVIVDCLTSTRFSPGSKLFGIVKTLLGEEPKEGVNLDLDTLIGADCVVTTETIQGERGNFSRVKEVKSAE